jgi:citrate synthase
MKKKNPITNIKKFLETIKTTVVYEVNIGKQTYYFDPDMFDLDIHNLGILNEQIARIPGYFAYIGIALSEIEKKVNSMKSAYEFYIAEKLAEFFNEKTESAKLNKVRQRYKKQLEEKLNLIQEEERIMRIIKTYKESLEAKFNLAQTLSANLRDERSKF